MIQFCPVCDKLMDVPEFPYSPDGIRLPIYSCGGNFEYDQKINNHCVQIYFGGMNQDICLIRFPNYKIRICAGTEAIDKQIIVCSNDSWKPILQFPRVHYSDPSVKPLVKKIQKLMTLT